jgi:hypothetical protein
MPTTDLLGNDLDLLGVGSPNNFNGNINTNPVGDLMGDLLGGYNGAPNGGT